jgi:hypothetical protein
MSVLHDAFLQQRSRIRVGKPGRGILEVVFLRNMKRLLLGHHQNLGEISPSPVLREWLE